MYSLAKPCVSAHPLWADSSTDQLILGFPYQLVGAGYDLVIVATDDGGILTDSVMITRSGRSVICLTKERHNELRERLRMLLGADSALSNSEYQQRREDLDQELKEKREFGPPGGSRRY